MDYKAMGQIYKGLAQTGAWGCFDEFNRIPVAVLSVCSTQYKVNLGARQLCSHRRDKPRECLSSHATARMAFACEAIAFFAAYQLHCQLFRLPLQAAQR
jgi:hypothetical protein